MFCLGMSCYIKWEVVSTDLYRAGNLRLFYLSAQATPPLPPPMCLSHVCSLSNGSMLHDCQPTLASLHCQFRSRRIGEASHPGPRRLSQQAQHMVDLGLFHPSSAYDGHRPGFFCSKGEFGQGYYRDPNQGAIASPPLRIALDVLCAAPTRGTSCIQLMRLGGLMLEAKTP